MRKLYLCCCILIGSVFAIEIEISPDKRVVTTNKDKTAIQRFYDEVFKFHLTDDGAYKLVKENRILANAYLKKYGLSSEDMTRIKVETELYLANTMVRKIQNKIKLSDKVLYSYYVDNKDKFKNADSVDLSIFYFKDPEKAFRFYWEAKDKNFEDAKKLAKQISKDVVIKDYKEVKLSTMKPFFKNLIKKYGTGHLMPPIFDEITSVSFIHTYHKAKGYKRFEDVKEEIRKILYNKTFLRERNKILLQYMGKK